MLSPSNVRALNPRRIEHRDGVVGHPQLVEEHARALGESHGGTLA
jgi:hypothetical protein